MSSQTSSRRQRNELALRMLFSSLLANQFGISENDSTGKWCQARQERVSTLMSSIFGTSVVHEKNEPVSDSKEMDILVDGMGFEPTTPTLRTWCSPS